MPAEPEAGSLSEGAKLLEQQILKAVQGLNLPSAGAPQKELQDGIKQNLDAIAFDRHNQMGIVEARAAFELTRGSEKLFLLEIIWDADKPVVGSTQKPHYGYEIYRDSKRVAGPGHVFFKAGVSVPHYRIKDVGLQEDLSLKLSKSGTLGNGVLKFETHYFKNKK
ncbi:hypothetical protein O1611_g7745 [Lasiodiplodia mahajangana]|uniref:Uncharacterized protein n=1 Tax=Lasiodiplodia mahajangana TaxID=1108764 RepID=A0ACC2JEL1_9PEZI|nr:hypothetical protein O1611_g7745 [Lasiodiplodia mahajangana]